MIAVYIASLKDQISGQKEKVGQTTNFRDTRKKKTGTKVSIYHKPKKKTQNRADPGWLGGEEGGVGGAMCLLLPQK